MGVSGISGDSNGQLPVPPNTNALDQDLEAYFQDPTSQNLAQVMSLLQQLEQNPNPTPQQSYDINQLEKAISQYQNVLQDIAEIQSELQKPGLPSNEREELEASLQQCENVKQSLQTLMLSTAKNLLG